jgi:molybdopterin/thiamine biosynthesis adenylyltransferase
MTNKPKIKDGVTVLYRKIKTGYQVSFYFPSSSKSYSFLLNRKGFTCLSFLKGELSVVEIAEKCSIHLSGLKHLINVLQGAGVLELNPISVPKKYERYARQMNFFADFETENVSRLNMQDSLAKASVGVIGLGGIGSWVINGLALAGIRNLTLIDPDVVEISNLSRQCLYGVKDVGYKKTRAIKRHLKLLDPKIKCECIEEKVDSIKKCRGLINGLDLVINCADYPDVDVMNRIVSSACFPRKIPHILCGGYDGHLSFIGPTIIPGETPCWFCYERKIDLDKKKSMLKHLPITDSHVQGGSIASISAITANIHVIEAVRILTHWSQPKMIGCIGEFDFLNLNITYSSFKKQRHCKQCGKD